MSEHAASSSITCGSVEEESSWQVSGNLKSTVPKKKEKEKKSQSLGGRVLLRIGANERTVRLSRRRATPTEGSGPVYYEIQPASYIGGIGWRRVMKCRSLPLDNREKMKLRQKTASFN